MNKKIFLIGLFVLLLVGCSVKSGYYGTYSGSKNAFVWAEGNIIKRVQLEIPEPTSRQKIDATGEWLIENNSFVVNTGEVEIRGTFVSDDLIEGTWSTENSAGVWGATKDS